MTANQSTTLVKNPQTKKAMAILQKFAKTEADYKAAEKEAKAATELIKEAMIAGGVQKIDIDLPDFTGYITLATRVTFKADDLEQVDEKYLKPALDTDKVKAEATLTGILPEGVSKQESQYITKKFKAKD